MNTRLVLCMAVLLTVTWTAPMAAADGPDCGGDTQTCRAAVHVCNGPNGPTVSDRPCADRPMMVK